MLNDFSENGKLNIILNYRPLGLVRATARGLGASGLAVETGCILLPGQAEVEVTFSSHQEGHHCVKRVPARITRSESGETRLEFDAEGKATVDSLYGRLFRVPVSPDSRSSCSSPNTA